MTDALWWDLPLDDLRAERREIDGRHLAVVTLDLPDKRNAMSDAMTDSWVRLMDALSADTELAAVVVTGAGPAFCAGGNLDWIVADKGSSVADLRRRMLAFYRSWLSIRALEVPTIAAVNGHAIGAGLAVALACDIRYVAQEARLGVPFTHLGLHPGMASTWSLPDVAGLAVARDLLLTGRVIDGDEAVRLGLASRALPSAQVLDEALGAGERIARSAPIASRLTTLALRDGGHAGPEEALQWEALAQAVTLTTDDVHEGIAAAAQKRPARFVGR
ncbi:enoyl-CoA hydratase/isomerase family protein [Luteipulveratus halotolerans]|uniref:Enoyl-CoA hydratase n=1 Tax=Luteipulveratus halotolerans TaxID=1631356 RepID=A0A0L6CFS2_9MICO|nr:enoyl-CoA hydratase-related protein [Luteipulveratus halotolerans]KNX36544.1 enoyl-CoA hydratase [Luteipulveratus halotolerans]